MLYADLPTRGDIQRLGAVRAGACVSIYLPITPLRQDAQADRIALKNLAGQAIDTLREHGTAQVAVIDEALAALAFTATDGRSADASTSRTEGLPSDVASAVGKASTTDRSVSGRIHGSEGQKVHMRQYARRVDQALPDRLAGSETPLILAAAQPLEAIFRSVCSYPHLLAETIAGNPETISDADLGQASRAVLDRLHQAEKNGRRRQFDLRSAHGRTTTDIAQAARSATCGAIGTLLVDIDDVVPGSIDDEGRVRFDDDGGTHGLGVVDQISTRAWASGARVLGLRRADIPGGGSLAAILRYPL